MARRKKAAALRPLERPSTGRKTRTNNQASASIREPSNTATSSPLTPRRSSRIRAAVIRRQQATDPSNGGSQNLTPPDVPLDPTLRGLLSAGPALENLLDYFNEWDRQSLIYVLPSLRDALRHPQVRPRFTCQNHPDPASLKRQDPGNQDKLTMVYNDAPHGRCSTPAQAPQGANAPAHLRRATLVRERNCQGYELGYTSNPLHPNSHGQHFWVCDVCARKAWERHSVLHNPRAVDLCLNCSQQHRLTHGTSDIDHCTCLWDQSEDKTHLCTSCREFKSERDARTMVQWVRVNLMTPIHNPRGEHISHYIDEHSARGESTCICGMPVRQKIVSHVLSAPLRLTLDELVRLCSYCHKQRFLTHSVRK
jgi:hypothetical protein